MSAPKKIQAMKLILPTAPFRPEPVINLADVPGYKEAVEKEHNNRLLAFFEVSQTICGFEVMPLTLRRYLLLQVCKNPIVSGKTSHGSDLVQFLLVMSPHFERRGLRGWIFRKRFTLKCWQTFRYSQIKSSQSDESWLKQNRRKITRYRFILRKIYENLNQAFQDAPGGAGQSKAYYHGATSSCGLLAKHFGWSEQSILDMPLSRIFQYARHCRELDALSVALETKTKYRNPLSNPSDDITAKFCLDEGRKNLENQ